jgi:hypothetical protein
MEVACIVHRHDRKLGAIRLKLIEGAGILSYVPEALIGQAKSNKQNDTVDNCMPDEHDGVFLMPRHDVLYRIGAARS